MVAVAWFTVVGALFILVALSQSRLARLPLSTAMVYLAVGVGLGSSGAGLIDVDPLTQSRLLEHIAEVAVIVSLFTAGLKLRLPLRDAGWRLPIQLATASMVISVGLVTLAGAVGLGLSLGAALVLGAVLAPTDPVLASDVQMQDPSDRDRVRFSLTGEAGVNDGTAFPFLMLGLGVLGMHEIGVGGWRWFAVDVLWAVAGGLAIGALSGTLVGRLVLYLRREHQEAVGIDDFLALGLIALSYGVALLFHTYGFLAVFAAGIALRHIELTSAPGVESETEPEVEMSDAPEQELAVDRLGAPGYMARAVLNFNEQLERIGEVAVVILLGGMLHRDYFTLEAVWFTAVLFLLIRPVAVFVGSIGAGGDRLQKGFIAWFGIRGMGSIYYVMYAAQSGLGEAEELIGLTFAVVTASIVLHGVSVTPMMTWYAARRGGAS